MAAFSPEAAASGSLSEAEQQTIDFAISEAWEKDTHREYAWLVRQPTETQFAF